MAKTNLRLVTSDPELRTVALRRRSNREMGRDREHLTEREVECLIKAAKGNRLIGLPMRANRNRHISAGLGNHKRSECGWAEARTCLRNFHISRKACIGGPTNDSAAFMMPPYSDQRLA